MTDKLNQLGKSLGSMKSDSEDALRRFQPDLSTIERARDVFDLSTPFEMTFPIRENDREHFLDLVFQKPPPDCLGGEWTVTCEGFSFTDGDAHLIQLSRGYFPDSLSVFVNDVPVSSSSIDQVDPGAGLVYVTGLNNATDVTVCYFFSCGCTASSSLFATAGVHSYNTWSPFEQQDPPFPTAGEIDQFGACVTDGILDTGFTFGAGLFYPDVAGSAERGWTINFSCGQTVQKINLYRNPDDGISEWPTVLWVGNTIVSQTIIGSYTFLPDKPFGWQQWILPAPVDAASIKIGQYFTGLGGSFQFFPWMRLNEVVFL